MENERRNCQRRTERLLDCLAINPSNPPKKWEPVYVEELAWFSIELHRNDCESQRTGSHFLVSVYCPKTLNDGSKIYGARVKRPLAEEPAPKDKWYTAGPMAYARPPIPDEQLDPTTLFGPSAVLQERYDDEEVQGGKIALIAVKQIRAQKPPNGLDRMQSTFSKQVAYNKRILEAEKEITEISIGVSQFLTEMTQDDPVYVCANSSEEMNRNERSIAGQLWIQGNRSMTASNIVPDGMADTKDSALLAAVSEAVSWNHASQPDQPRQGQRIVIYPEHLTQMDEFLTSCDPNVDPDDGHPLAYATILQEQAKYVNTPIIVNESSEFVTADPFLSQCVPGWMSKAEQIATGYRHRTLEDGRDVLNSDDEDDEDMKPDELTGMYTAEMLDSEGKPKSGPKVLTATEANRQRSAARAAKASKVPTTSQPLAAPSQYILSSAALKPLPTPLLDSEEEYPPQKPDPPRSRSPYCPEGEDWSWMNPNQLKLAEAAARAHAEGKTGLVSPPRSPSSPSFDAPSKKSMEPKVQAPAKGVPLDIKKATPAPQAPADQPIGAKAPTQTKAQGTKRQAARQQSTGQPSSPAQASPGTSAPPPMETRARKKASGAGSLRGVTGSGQTGTGVDHEGPPPQNLSRNLFP
jgi:hypothetical protein